MKRLEERLQARKQDNNLRSLPASQELIDFASNDYLGLAQSEEIFLQTQSIFKQYVSASQLNGATGSRLITGNSALAEKLEIFLAQLYQAPAALIFNSGYNANLSILSSVPQRGDTILYDEAIHASLKDGARLSCAQRMTFRHNNLADLHAKLNKASGEKYVVVESLYSMDGDFCPLAELVQLCTESQAHLIVDEAHSTGLWGKGGAGICVDAQLHTTVFARIYTFGKAVGQHGACIAGSQNLIDYLINFARPFIYTTALPMHSLAGILAAHLYLADHAELSEGLFRNIRYFQHLTHTRNAPGQAEPLKFSPIQAVMVPGNGQAQKFAAVLQTNGFQAKAILNPTVKAGQERIRVCLHSYNTQRQIRQLTDLLNNLQAS